MIGAEEAFRALKDGSHLDLTAAFLQEMRKLGHAAGDEWLAENLAIRWRSLDRWIFPRSHTH